MTKKTFIILIIAATVLLIVSYCQFGVGPSKEEVTLSPTSKTKSLVKASVPPPEALASSSGSAGFLPTQMEDPNKFVAYQKSFQEMAECLNMKVGTPDPQAEINFDYFNTLISEDLGDIVGQSEEWISLDLRTPSGEIRRIYVESTGDEVNPGKRLQYFSFNGGEARELPLTEEQKSNPSEQLMASLEKDGEIIARSVSRRIFYRNGDDLLLVERNGKIYSFQLPHDGKTFSCTKADSASTMTCQCK